MADTNPRVTVVVPVYNAGEYLEPCVDSLLAQTLPPDRLELIFVDDGSTDDSLARLHALEAEHPNVRVITIPSSGWPGRPRNVGTDAARGEYVMYVDQDDTVEPEALERMYDVGSANNSDVILGKVISDFRGVHHYLYRENRARCTVHNARLMSSQTPHKMLRTAFLRAEGIRFAEGRRRLEDQLFITQAYFAASSVSIVADYVCYRYLRRDDAGNAGSHRIDPASYYDNLREVLDVVDANTEPGEFRDRWYRRFLKTEMLSRLGGRKLFNAPDDHRPELLAEIRRLMQERFPPAVIAGLPAALRSRAALVGAGTLDDLVAYAERISELRPVATLTKVAPASSAGVEVGVEVEFRYAGEPLRLEPAGTDWLLPRALVGPEVTDADRVVESLSEMVGDVVIRHRDQLDEWFLPGGLEPGIESTADGGRLRWRGTAVLDPDSLAGGGPLRRGVHDLVARVDAFGINRTVRFGAERAPGASTGPLAILGRGRSVLYVNRGGNLSVRAGASRAAATRVITDGARLHASDCRLRVDLPAAWAKPPKVLRIRLTPVERGKAKTIDLRRSDAAWRSATSALHGLDGEFAAEVQLRSLGRVPLGSLTVVMPRTQKVRKLLDRGLRSVGRRLPEPLVSRLGASRVVRRLRSRRPG